MSFAFVAGDHTPAEYRVIKMTPGARYRVWFRRPVNFETAWWNVIYSGLNVAERFKQYWNTKYGNFFYVENLNLLNDAIELVGQSRSSKSFLELPLERWWSSSSPRKVLFLRNALGIWEERGVEGIQYKNIFDMATGRDIADVEQFIPPTGEEILPPAGGTQHTPAGGTSLPAAAYPSAAKSSATLRNTLIFIGAGAVSIAVVIGAYRLLGKKNRNGAVA